MTRWPTRTIARMAIVLALLAPALSAASASASPPYPFIPGCYAPADTFSGGWWYREWTCTHLSWGDQVVQHSSVLWESCGIDCGNGLAISLWSHYEWVRTDTDWSRASVDERTNRVVVPFTLYFFGPGPLWMIQTAWGRWQQWDLYRGDFYDYAGNLVIDTVLVGDPVQRDDYSLEIPLVVN